MERLFIVENGKAYLRLVRSGAHYGDAIEILSGIEAGEQVVVEGQNNLKDGQPVVLQ
jgi:multidrug efflux pump subunit AcrA (membrane-fusion protein)